MRALKNKKKKKEKKKKEKKEFASVPFPSLFVLLFLFMCSPIGFARIEQERKRIKAREKDDGEKQPDEVTNSDGNSNVASSNTTSSTLSSTDEQTPQKNHIEVGFFVYFLLLSLSFPPSPPLVFFNPLFLLGFER